jgi:hypothetical protein
MPNPIMIDRKWWRTALFSAVMLMLAAAADAAMDKLSFRYGESTFARQPAAYQRWLNPAISWPNKWKNGDRKQGEAFPLSSTALVWTTDAWHLFKSIMSSCLLLAIMAPFWRLVHAPWWMWIIVFFGLSALWGAVSNFFFSGCFSCQAFLKQTHPRKNHCRGLAGR